VYIGPAGWLGISHQVGGLNHRGNGYRIACKPPGCRQLTPPEGFQLELAARGSVAGASVPTVGPSPAGLVPAGRNAAVGPSRSCRNSRRNAVGPVGVKLVAAPDAPHWGEVLVRSPSDRFSSARRGATSKFTCLSRDYQVCPALYGDPGRAGPRPRWPASSGGGGRRGQKISRPLTGLRIARYPAQAVCRADMAAIAATRTQQRESADRTGGDPHPGKDPL
jgi:hypothetical protein